MGGADNHAYDGLAQDFMGEVRGGGMPLGDDPSVLNKLGEAKIDEETRTHLLGHLLDVWDMAKREKLRNGIEEDLLDCLRMFSGKYDAHELADLTMRGMPLVYFPLSEHKVHTAVAWLDEFFADGENIFSISPTPLPELERDVEAETAMRTMKMAVEAAQQTGEVPPPEMVQKTAEIARPLVERELEDDAKQRALRMQRVIRDDLLQGKWGERIHEVIGYASIYGTAAFRSPVIRVKHELAWKGGKLRRQDRVVRTFEAISPFDLFPTPGMTDTQVGDLCVRVRYQPNALAAMKKQPLWFKDAIDRVLSRFGRAGVRLDVTSDTERRTLTSQESVTETDGVLEGFEFWGAASGQMLAEIGIERDPQGKKIADTPTEWYEVNAIVIGNEVVYCRVMRDVEDRPVDVVKFYDTPGSFWGRGPLQLISSLQRICNAAGRSIVTNMGFSAGPQSILDLSQIDPRDDLKMRPCKAWVVRRTGMNNQGAGKPVDFFQVESNAKSLTDVFEFFQRLADEVTGIPAYANGTDAATGAARTATGLNMLFGAANRGIKKVVGNFDELCNKSIRRLFMWHMEFNRDDSIKGDLSVKICGLRLFVTKTSQANDRLTLISRITQDQRMAALQSPEELARLMREIAVGMDLPPDALAPDSEELARRQEEARQNAMAQEQKAAAQQQQAQAAKLQQIEASQGPDRGAGGGERNTTPTGRPVYAQRPENEGGA